MFTKLTWGRKMARLTCALTMRSLVVLLLELCVCSAMFPPPGEGRMLSNDSMRLDYGDYGNMAGGMQGDGMTEGDSTYCDMLLNAPVPPTADQVPWFCICTSCKGTPGPKGDRGDRGLPGRPGSPGRRGLQGFPGRPGFMGREGVKGEKGDEGLKGDKGPVGYSGPKGARGFKGDKGDAGVEGPQGPDGPKGADGECPEFCESVVGDPGQPGLPGSPGPRGMPGAEGPSGSPGAKGDMGDNGMPGEPGTPGQKGDQGAEGDCNCSDGAEGAPGPAGAKGEKGEVGDQGVLGETGPAGPKGDMGNMGMMGPPGPCTPAIQSSFSAALAFSFPSPNLPVPFPNVLTNMQGHFNPTMGIYTAPANGTYVFHYHLSVYDRVLKVGLFHNFAPVVKTTEAAELGTASQTVVLHLNRMDMVWLQVRDLLTNGAYTSSETSSTFSGYLLQPDSCDLPLFGRDFLTPPAPPMQGEYSWGELPVYTTTAPPTPTEAAP